MEQDEAGMLAALKNRDILAPLPRTPASPTAELSPVNDDSLNPGERSGFRLGDRVRAALARLQPLACSVSSIECLSETSIDRLHRFLGFHVSLP
jgi:hypothetical protein